MICTGSVVSGYRLIPTQIYNKYTFKEIISDDFLNNFYPYAKNYTGSELLSIFRSHKYDNYSAEESIYLFNKILDALVNEYSSKSYITDGYTYVIDLLKKVANNNIDYSIIIKNIFEKKLFKAMKLKGENISNFIDEIISKSKFDNAEEMIKLIQEQVPDYRSFPLIIMNENITREEKLKALKLVYRQKDFPQYKSFFRSNLVDLNDLDAFIEATIIQNNRVKEKEANIIKLFKDIFVNGDTSAIFRKTLKHEKEFSIKYSEYFMSKDFCRKFYNETVSSMSTNGYTRTRNYENFIRLIFSHVDTRKQIKALQESKELEELGSGFTEKFREAYEDQDYELAEDLLKVFITWSEKDKFKFFKCIPKDISHKDIINRFENSDAITKYLNNISIIDYNGIDEYSGNSALSDDMNYVIDIFFNKKIFSRTQFMKDEYLNNLGFNYEESKRRFKKKNNWGGSIYNAYGTYSRIRETMNSLCSTILSNFIVAAEKGDWEFAEAIINKFVTRFEDPNVTSEFTENVMNIHSDSETKEMRRWGNNELTINFITSVRDRFIEVADAMYKVMISHDPSYETRHEIFKENFEESTDTISLVCVTM